LQFLLWGFKLAFFKEKNYKGRDIMSTAYQIKKIHTLKNILGLDDDLYREMLASFDVYSSKNLTETEAQIFIEILEEKIIVKNKNIYKKYEELKLRDEVMATPAQLRKMEVIWSKIPKDKNRTLRKFLQNHFYIDDLRFLTKNRASKIIPVLEKIKNSKCLKAI
jgi:hypothetical protein